MDKEIFEVDMILTKITHSMDFNKKDSYIYAITLMGLFTFLFLGVEYFFVNVLSHIVPEAQTVLAQNYVLGILLQFVNNNLIHSELAEMIVLSVFLLILFCCCCHRIVTLLRLFLFSFCLWQSVSWQLCTLSKRNSF